MNTPIRANRDTTEAADPANTEIAGLTTSTDSETTVSLNASEEIVASETPAITTDDFFAPKIAAKAVAPTLESEPYIEPIATEPDSPFRDDAAELLTTAAIGTTAKAITTDAGHKKASADIDTLATPAGDKGNAQKAHTKKTQAEKTKGDNGKETVATAKKKDKPVKRKPRTARGIRFLIYLAFVGAAAVVAVLAANELTKSAQTFAPSADSQPIGD